MTNSNSTSFYIFPAEFSPHTAIWLNADDESYWSGSSRLPVIADLVETLAPYVNIMATIKSEASRCALKRLLHSRSISDAHVTYVLLPHTNAWVRDIGPVFLQHTTGRIALANFGYSYYNEPDPTPGFSSQVAAINYEIAAQLALPIRHTCLVSEGGNHEVNGKGTLIALAGTELDRNPGWSQAQIEQELRAVLGQKKMIWLNQSLAIEDKCTRGPLWGDLYSATITGGHIDEVCRFADAGTVLLAEVTAEEARTSPVLEMSRARMLENYAILNAATDQANHPFRIVRMPVPDMITATYVPQRETDYALTYFKGGKVGQPIQYALSASYLNFLVTNGVVIAPAYWQEGRPESTRKKDQAARDILQQVFPDRAIIQINCEAFNHGGGGIHCNTRQQPCPDA